MTSPSPDPQIVRFWTLAVTSLAFFSVGLDGLVVVTALPAIHDDLAASTDTLQWVVNTYTLAWAASITTGVALGDHHGRRRWFAVGLTLFTVASAGCALSPTIQVLIAARALQGVGAGLIMPLSLTILTSAFGPERRGTIVGIWGGIAGIAVAAGPLVGGAITQSLGWHWIFWLNVPLGVIGASLTLRYLAESFGSATELDLIAVMLVAGGSVGIVLGLVRGPTLGWNSPVTIATLAGGLVLTAGFLAWEVRAPAPMVAVRLFRSVSFSAANATGFMQSGAVFGGIFLVTQYFQLGVGYSPFETGLRLLPWTVGPLLLAPVAGALSDRVGRRPLLVVGMLLQAVSVAWFAQLASAGVEYWRLALPLALTGIGVGIVLPVAPTAVLNAVHREDIGQASGVSSTLQRFGGAFGVAVAATVFAACGGLGSSPEVINGFRPSLTVIAGLAAIGAMTSVGVGSARMTRPGRGVLAATVRGGAR